jgi:hypothetical protein
MFLTPSDPMVIKNVLAVVRVLVNKRERIVLCIGILRYWDFSLIFGFFIRFGVEEFRPKPLFLLSHTLSRGI